MILFFDTETTGFVERHLQLDHQDQPHLVQLAALLTEDDGTERAAINLIVDPGVPIPEKAAAVHGISTERAQRCGFDPQTACSIFDLMLLRATTLVAHNIEFDRQIMMIAALRHIGSHLAELSDLPAHCTMRAATPVCRILHHSPRHPEDWKWPKLAECIRHFFDEELVGAHDALADVRACKRVYFHLREIGAIA